MTLALSKAIGQRVRELRMSRTLSQARLAKDAELSQRAVSDLERGRFTASLETLEKLARALGCGVSDLVSLGEEQDTPKEAALRTLVTFLHTRTVEDVERLYRAAVGFFEAPRPPRKPRGRPRARKSPS